MIQTRLRDIDRFFFIIRRRRLFTEVLAPDGIASGLAQVGLFMGDDKNVQTSLVRFFSVRSTRGKLRPPKKKNGGFFGRRPHEDEERSCGVTLFADEVFEKSPLEKGTADECEHTVVRRMGDVNSALETYGL